jgi:excisionase family DNA binding protein
MSRFLTVKEMSNYLQVKESTIYSWVESGFVPHVKLNRLVRFDREEIDNWLAGQKRVPVDVDKTVRRILNVPRNGDLERIIKKAIAEEKDMMYSSSNGKPDRIKGHRKEVSNEPN